MTCIIGLVDNGIVYMGGDSAATTGDEVRISDEPKVFKRDGMIMGYCGSPRVGQLLHYKLSLSPRPEDISDMAYLVGVFIEDVRTCLRNGGIAEVDNNIESGGHFMVGYRGKLYLVDYDYLILSLGNMNAIGSGREYALGAMEAQSYERSPHERIATALSIAEQFCGSVRSPFMFEQLEEAA